ncbi:MAG TPA: hypothetical protein VK993_07210, partial [Chthoniobacterales bacterium]|nr:hypothetical protein [Chthoniobacterales bacterium]
MARNGNGKNAHVKNGAAKRTRKRSAGLPPSVSNTRPTLIVIGGREDKIGDALILREVVRHVGDGKLVVTTVASSEPEGLFEEYDEIFCKLGVKEVEHLAITSRAEAKEKKIVSVLDDANAVFF